MSDRVLGVACVVGVTCVFGQGFRAGIRFRARVFAGIVVTSLRYIAIGSSTFSPILNAVVGADGDTSTSACSNADAKSRWMSVRTFCALP